MGSLGGDITANHINPAGIGLYKTNEVVFTPGLGFNKNTLSYRGSDTLGNSSHFNYGTTGLILGNAGYGGKWTSVAFAISVNQLANYNNHIQFKGFNNQSSFT